MQFLRKFKGRSLGEVVDLARLKMLRAMGWRGKKAAIRHLAENLSVLPIGKLRRPIFIVGCARSGTTIFNDLFMHHPDLATWPQGEAMSIWYPGYSKGDAAFHQDSVHAARPDERAEKDRRRIEARFWWAQVLQGKPRFATKNTHITVRLLYVRRMFPDCQFLYIERDGRAVSNSIVNAIQQDPGRAQVPMGRFTKPPNWRELLSDDLVEQSAKQWLHVVMTAEADLAEMPPESVLRIRYEDLCTDTRSAIDRSWQFCGLIPGGKVLSTLPVTLKNQNSKWRADRTPDEIETLQRILASKLTEMNYTDGQDW